MRVQPPRGEKDQKKKKNIGLVLNEIPWKQRNGEKVNKYKYRTSLILVKIILRPLFRSFST